MAPIKVLISLLLTAFLLSSAAPAFALSIPGRLGADVQLGVNGTIVDGTSQDATTGPAYSTADAQGDENADLSLPLVVTQADISAHASQQALAATSGIGTRSALSTYIASRLRADANLVGVDAAPDHVAVTYLEPGFFLNIVPVAVQTTVTTDASGNISLTHPWWELLSGSTATTIGTRVQTAVNEVLGTDTSADAQLTVSQQAQLEAAIEAALAASARSR